MSDALNGAALMQGALRLSQQMQAYADDGQWTELAESMAERQTLLDEIDFQDGTIDPEQLRQIISIDKSLSSLARTARDATAEELRGFQTVRKGLAAYQSATE